MVLMWGALTFMLWTLAISNDIVSAHTLNVQRITQRQQSAAILPTLTVAVNSIGELHAALDMIVDDNRNGVRRGHIITLEPAIYSIRYSIQLSAEHSGTSDTPTIIQGANTSAEAVQLSGGLAIPVRCFRPISENVDSRYFPAIDRMSATTKLCGFLVNLAECFDTSQTPLSFSSYIATGVTEPVLPVAPQLHSFKSNKDGRDWHLSRWPNKYGSFTNWTFIDDVKTNGSQFSFAYDNETADHLNHLEADDLDDVWMRGYWQYESLDQTIRLASIDAENQRVHASPVPYFGIRSSARVYYDNILSELDTPYEYYLDKLLSTLYIFPVVCGIAPNDLLITQLSSPLMIIDSAKHIIIRDLAIQSTRGSGIIIKNSSYITVNHTHIRHIGNVGIVCGIGSSYNNRYRHMNVPESMRVGNDAAVGNLMTDLIGREWWDRQCGSHHLIANSLIHHCGAGAIIMGGGKRENLEFGNNTIVDNTLHDYSQLWRTNHAAVTVDGVGQVITRNRIYNGAHAAIILFGNDHDISYNEISQVCSESSDAGAIYTGRDWTQRNYYIHHNVIHSLISEYEMIPAHRHGLRNKRAEYCHEDNMNDVDCYEQYGALQAAVYLDDFSSDHRIEHNIIIGVSRGVCVNGGRDVVVSDNIFIDVDVPLHMDARGINLPVTKGKVIETIRQRLRGATAFMNERRWQEHYPMFEELWTADMSPVENVVINNLFVASGPLKVATVAERLMRVRMENVRWIIDDAELMTLRQWQSSLLSATTNHTFFTAIKVTVVSDPLVELELASLQQVMNSEYEYTLWDDFAHSYWRRMTLSTLTTPSTASNNAYFIERLATRLLSRSHCYATAPTRWTSQISIQCQSH